MRSRGRYLGTLRLDRPWYNRSVEPAGLPGKGEGEFWYDYKGFYFVRGDSGKGLVIPSESILRVRIGYWHGLIFSGAKVLKVVWKASSEKLSSGFIVSHPHQVKEALTATGWA